VPSGIERPEPMGLDNPLRRDLGRASLTDLVAHEFLVTGRSAVPEANRSQTSCGDSRFLRLPLLDQA
jgi:hypothetical protein